MVWVVKYIPYRVHPLEIVLAAATDVNHRVPAGNYPPCPVINEHL
ncbi:unnamed protein product [Staurois parvus]|uniref:Uncharacterized protein n=1 Tax=Staurois parvus TaxID=386267 RepID=A0ABN9C2W1_9NEOB|nr:unnamed protein product [Staurois parvus]